MAAIRHLKRLAYFCVSAALAAGILMHLLRSVDLQDILRLIVEVDRNALAMFVVLSLAGAALRTWRYQLVLGAAGHRPGSLPLFLVVLVRNCTSDLLPARLGGAVYLYLVNVRLAVPLAPAVTSLALTFLFDLLAIAPLVVVALLFTAGLPRPALGAAAASLAAAVVILLFALPRLCRLAEGWCRGASAARLLRSAAASCAKFSARLADEIERTRGKRIYGRLFVLSLLVRTAKYASLYIFLFALLKPLGYTPAQLNPLTVFLGICAAELAASLPIAFLGGFGLYEGTWSVVFSALNFPDSIAKLTALSHHLFTQAYGYALGLMALLLLLLPFERWKRRAPAAHGPRALFAAQLSIFMIAVLLCLAAAAQAPLAKERRTAAAAAEPGAGAALQLSADLAQTRLVFDSNRSGTFGIYSMRMDGGETRVVFDSAQHDIYPDPSPDGRTVVFARAPSLMRSGPSDVWLVETDGRNPRLLTKDGTFPTFSRDGRSVYFERQRRKVMQIDIGSREEREIFPVRSREFRGYEIVKPRVSPDGRLVAFISDRPGAWHAWYADLATLQAGHIGQGCEPAWFEDGERIAWIRGAESRAGSGIYAFDRRSGGVAVLTDEGPPRGREYFPTLALGDRLLLFSSAPADQHAHESANYQLFMTDLENGRTHQLTRSSYTDRWPKMLTSQAATSHQN